MVSHEHKCIFIHIPKTAGTSIAHKLGQFQNVERGVQDHATLRDVQPLTPRDLLRPHRSAGRLRHTARLARAMARQRIRRPPPLSRAQFESYYRFTVVRNPWSRAFSWYENVMKDGVHREALGLRGECAFADFLTRFPDQWALRPQLHWLSDHFGELPFDRICRFERLADDFRDVCRALGLADAALPHLAFGRGRDYRAFYDERTIDLIAQRYAEEIALFNFRFGQ